MRITTVKTNKHKISVGKMGIYWNPCTLVVGIENGVAAMENRTVVPQKVKNRVTVWSRNSTSEYHPEEWEARSQRDSCMFMFTTSLFVTAEVGT